MALRDVVAVIGGADPDDPRDPDHHGRHLAVGALMITIAAWAFVASLLAFHSNFHGPWAVSVVGAVILASIIFLVDVLVTVVPLKSDSGAARFRVIFIRSMLSLGVGLIVSHSTILFIYRDDLAAMVTTANNHQVEQITETTTAASQWTKVRSQAEDQVKKDQERIGAEETTLRDAQRRLDDLKHAWEADTVCVNGNRAANGDLCGDGPESKKLYEAYEAFRVTTLPGVQANHDTAVAELRKDIEKQNQVVTDANAKLAVEVDNATKAARANLGLQAQNTALLKLLSQDWTAWLWPIFFFLIDIAVAFMKGVLPESNFDRKRRAQAPLQPMIAAALLTPVPAGASSDLQDVLAHAAKSQAKIAKAQIDRNEQRRLASTGHGGVRIPARRVAFAVGALVVVTALVLGFVRDGDPEPDAGMTANGGQTISLRDGMALRVPVGAISGDEPVVAAYPDPAPWAQHRPVSAPVDFSTSGDVVGQPVLSFAVPEPLWDAAAQGAVQAAFRSDDPSGWTEYPVTYNPESHAIEAALTHFSTWQFWTWDWTSILAQVSQTAGEWTGRRASDTPECDSGLPRPGWVNADAGITDDPAMVIRSCLQGHKGDDTLDVQIVNNRPYGMVLRYEGAPIAYDRHEDPDNLSETFRNLIGDLGVSGGRGLYLPPLSRASVGIRNLGNGVLKQFVIAPTQATITADVFAVLVDQIIGRGVEFSSKKFLQDVFAAAAASSCSQMVIDNTEITPATVHKWLTGTGISCIRDILVIAGRNEIRGGAADLGTLNRLSGWIGRLKSVAAGPEILKWLNRAGDVLDFTVDKSAAVKGLEYGFSILSKYTYVEPTTSQPPAPPTTTPKPPARTSPPPAATTRQPTAPRPPITTEPPPTTTAPQDPSRKLLVYDNYGPVTTAGTAMCAANPKRPESMPSGTVEQTFTIPAEATSVESATVQIDHNPSMTVRARLSVNGAAQATDDRTPVGDTTFTFGRVPVRPGDRVTLALSWTATAGKLDTIYTTGSPPDSHLVITNNCPDYGTPRRLDTTATGLRATVTGWTG
ncbi:DUF4407 domain-containing protein [Saccharothrix saharensis]|uniref:DUF4407 domain-containing protein n=1 Tax=Saccharothrix saharensis TaxID=571190 RepID=UPI0036B25187